MDGPLAQAIFMILSQENLSFSGFLVSAKGQKCLFGIFNSSKKEWKIRPNY